MAGPTIVDQYGDRMFRSYGDPSQNVRDLNDAASKRQDDLRKASNRLLKSEIRRLDGEASHLKEMLKTTIDHNKEIRAAETERLNSIRQVDVAAVRTEADRALSAIQTLAATNKTDAENLRNALNTTATTIAKSTADTFTQVTERLSALEKAYYEGVGKQRVADPQMLELFNKVDALVGTKSGGIDQVTKIIIAIVGLAIAAAMYFKP